MTKTQRFKTYWPMLVIVVIVSANWAFVLHRQALQEFDDPQDVLVSAYGIKDSNSCYLLVNGKMLQSRRDNYKMAIGCFLYNGVQDILDAPNVQVSDLYDIKDSYTPIRLIFSDGFNQYRREKGPYGIYIALLNVPNGVSISQFTTLRQARSLKVLIPAMQAAVDPPSRR